MVAELGSSKRTVPTREAQRTARHSSARTAGRAVQSFVTVGRELVEPRSFRDVKNG